MVRPEGVEPPTYWFVASCSIQLSYGRTLQGSQLCLEYRRSQPGANSTRPNRHPQSRSEVVRPEGLEPPTLWFEARCSIQLSYGRINQPSLPYRNRTAKNKRALAGRLLRCLAGGPEAQSAQPSSTMSKTGPGAAAGE